MAISDVFGYIPETGELYRLSNCRVCGTKNANGAMVVNDKGTVLYVHRVAFMLMTGRWPHHIDHIDGDATNNAWSNLREVDHSTNMKNRKLSSNNTSGKHGVSWHKAAGKWHARIYVHGRCVDLGLHTELSDAIAAREAAEHIHGYHSNHGRIQ